MLGPPSLDSFSDICLWIAFFKSCTVAFCITTTAENIKNSSHSKLIKIKAPEVEAEKGKQGTGSG